MRERASAAVLAIALAKRSSAPATATHQPVRTRTMRRRTVHLRRIHDCQLPRDTARPVRIGTRRGMLHADRCRTRARRPPGPGGPRRCRPLRSRLKADGPTPETPITRGRMGSHLEERSSSPRGRRSSPSLVVHLTAHILRWSALPLAFVRQAESAAAARDGLSSLDLPWARSSHSPPASISPPFAVRCTVLAAGDRPSDFMPVILPVVAGDGAAPRSYRCRRRGADELVARLAAED